MPSLTPLGETDIRSFGPTRLYTVTDKAQTGKGGCNPRCLPLRNLARYSPRCRNFHAVTGTQPLHRAHRRDVDRVLRTPICAKAFCTLKSGLGKSSARSNTIGPPMVSVPPQD